MLQLFVKNNKIIQSTGVSFAVLGTSMHMLNVINLMSSSLSHTWSAIAIVGFCLTLSSQTGGMLSSKLPRIKKQKPIDNGINDVTLP